MVNNARKPFAQKCNVFLHRKEENVCSFIFRVPNPNFYAESSLFSLLRLLRIASQRKRAYLEQKSINEKNDERSFLFVSFVQHK